MWYQNSGSSNAEYDSRLDEGKRKELNQHVKRKMSGDFRKTLYTRLQPTHILEYMNCISDMRKESIKQKQTNKGKIFASYDLVDILTKESYTDWGIEFLDSLCLTGQDDIARALAPDYYSPPHVDDESGFSPEPEQHIQRTYSARPRSPPPPYSQAISSSPILLSKPDESGYKSSQSEEARIMDNNHHLTSVSLPFSLQSTDSERTLSSADICLSDM